MTGSDRVQVAAREATPGSAELTALVEELIVKHGVPGASVAIRHSTDVMTGVAGVLNIDTAVEVTPESLFQIGSNSKVYTATVIMQLVDEGTVALDAPVETYLPDFRLAGGVAAHEITVRHLLTHTSGIDGGDYIADFGRGDDAVARYVASLSEVGLVHPVGRYRSYCNAAAVVAGRIVEVVTDLSWREALRARLLEPLGLAHTVTLPEEAIFFRAAVGHVPTSVEDQALRVHPTWMLPIALGPAGSMINATASDLSIFGFVHLAGGMSSDDTRLLSEHSAAAMREPQFPAAFRVGRGSTGIAWSIGEFGGAPVAMHEGSTLGQQSLLAVLPEHGVVLASMTNGHRGNVVSRDVLNDLIGRLTGGFDPADLDVGEASHAVGGEVDSGRSLDAYAGVFERKCVRTTIEVAGQALRATSDYSGFLEQVKLPDAPIVLVPQDDSTFDVVGDENGGPARQVAFTEFDGAGRPAYFIAGRVARRVSTQALR